MSWAKVDPDAPQHPKHHHLARGQLERFGFFVASLCYAAKFLTDGFVAEHAVNAIFPGTGRATCLRLASELVVAGLWEVRDDGWQIHDYLKYHPTRTEELEDRRQQLAKSAAGGLARSAKAHRIQGRFTSQPTSPQPASGLVSAGDTAGPAVASPAPASYSTRTRIEENLNYVGEVGHFGTNSPLGQGEPTPLTPDPPSLTSVLTSATARRRRNGFDPAAARVLEFLNEKTGRHFRPVATNLRFIEARLRDGHTEQQLKVIVTRKYAHWHGDPKMDEYLRPATLFNRVNCEQYRGELP